MKETNTNATYESWLSKYGGNANGMMLRDYFAAKAMQAYCSHSNSSDWTPHEIAKDAYAMADAMMEARDGNP